MISVTNGVSSGVTRKIVKMAKKKGDEKVNQAPQSDNEEQNLDEEPDFEDPEGFVDDIPDEGGHFSVKQVEPAICITHAFSSFSLKLCYFYQTYKTLLCVKKFSAC